MAAQASTEGLVERREDSVAASMRKVLTCLVTRSSTDLDMRLVR